MEGWEWAKKRAREGEGRIAERRLIKLADTEEGNVDIIRNIRDAVKVIRFHIRGISHSEESVAEVEGPGRDGEGTARGDGR